MWEIELQAGGKPMDRSTENKQTQSTGTFTRATANTTTHHCAHVHDTAPSQYGKSVNVPLSERSVILLTLLLIIS